MKVSSLAGAASATRNAMLQILTQSSAAATAPGSGPPLVRPAAMAPPPPRASSFGGADPRAMFEALVQNFDSDGDGKLSLGEVNALNQGGLLARSFGRLDSNGDGALSSDEVAASAPWASSLPTTGDQGRGEQGADVRPLFDKLTDHLNSNRDAALIAEDLAAIRRAEFAAGFDKTGGSPATPSVAPPAPAPDGLIRSSADPVSLMQSMVMALSSTLPVDADIPQPGPTRRLTLR